MMRAPGIDAKDGVRNRIISGTNIESEARSVPEDINRTVSNNCILIYYGIVMERPR